MDSIVTSLAKFAVVLHPGPKGAAAFGESPKARLAVEAMFAIANRCAARAVVAAGHAVHAALVCCVVLVGGGAAPTAALTMPSCPSPPPLAPACSPPAQLRRLAAQRVAQRAGRGAAPAPPGPPAARRHRGCAGRRCPPRRSLPHCCSQPCVGARLLGRLFAAPQHLPRAAPRCSPCLAAGDGEDPAAAAARMPRPASAGRSKGSSGSLFTRAFTSLISIEGSDGMTAEQVQRRLGGPRGWRGSGESGGRGLAALPCSNAPLPVPAAPPPHLRLPAGGAARGGAGQACGGERGGMPHRRGLCRLQVPGAAAG